MRLYKVLNKDLTSPFRGFQYEIGKEYVCENFDGSDEECSDGFYATELEGLPYSLRLGKKVFEVEVRGKNKKFDQYKWRWEKQTIIREVPEEELKELLKAENEKVEYNLHESCFPVHPLKLKPLKVEEQDIENLKKWDSVWASVGDSVGASVRDSVGASVRDSVRDSVRAYMSSLFPNIKKWEYIDHKEGENPFQPCIDLWRRGFVASYDGKTWRLHSGENAKIVYELED